jgi:phosphoglycolate phosphatase-like HAD superfamily hydrolase
MARTLREPAAVVFDCDGVLLDSNELKSSCFREVLEAAGFTPSDVARFSAFQRANFGTSRYRLFETLLTWDLAVRPRVDHAGLLAAYAGLLRGRYVTTPATPGMRDVVAGLAARLPLYIVSGSDEAELREVLGERGDAPPFRKILGSPTPKPDNLAQVLADLAAHDGVTDPASVLFIGDAEADFKAAESLGTSFVYMDRFSTAQPRMRELAAVHGFPLIDDLRGLSAVLRASHATAVET